MITPEEIIKIRAGITEDRFFILREIYMSPGIRHKELCSKLNKTPSNLSNILKKINMMEISLIQTETGGTEKYYSLTDIAKQYIEQEQFANTQFSKSDGFQSKATENIVDKIIKNLSLFKEKCGSGWRPALIGLLSGTKEAADNDEIQKAYDNLLDSLCRCRKRDLDELQQVFTVLEDEMLSAEIARYLDKKFFYFDCMKPLSSSGKMDMISRFKMIDMIFFELHPLIFSSCQNDESLKSLLTDSEYHNLLIGIIKLSNEFIDGHYTKNTALEKWNDYFLTGELAFYIAEKCSVLLFLHRFIPAP